jgi:Zn-dependent metalloprotease
VSVSAAARASASRSLHTGAPAAMRRYMRPLAWSAKLISRNRPAHCRRNPVLCSGASNVGSAYRRSGARIAAPLEPVHGDRDVADAEDRHKVALPARRGVDALAGIDDDEGDIRRCRCGDEAGHRKPVAFGTGDDEFARRGGKVAGGRAGRGAMAVQFAKCAADRRAAVVATENDDAQYGPRCYNVAIVTAVCCIRHGESPFCTLVAAPVASFAIGRFRARLAPAAHRRSSSHARMDSGDANLSPISIGEMAMSDRSSRAVRSHARQCILPPHILREIAKNGTAEERAAAREALASDRALRDQRAALAPPRAVAPARAAAPSRRRTIFDAAHTQALPGKAVRKEGAAASGDAAVDEAYDGLGATFDFYLEAYRRNSIDDAGMPLDATVHFGTRYDNAFWNGAQMVFGDGDGRLFNRFTVAQDVIGHELTHGVTAREAALVYRGQSGALNESLSDVFGSLIKQYARRQDAGAADWLIGAGLLATGVKGVALRSMKAPGTAYHDPVLGKDPQPAHMKDYVRTTSDNGGVHINSGIPNHAFYLAAVAIGGAAWTSAGRIWYEALRDPTLKANANFAAFAKLTVAVAGRLYPPKGREASAVASAWQAVGVLQR